MIPVLPDDPFRAFDAWFQDARRAEPDVPEAMQVATVDAQGRPSLRTVLLKDHGPDGFTFYTNLGSRKALDLAHTPWVAATFHWKALQRQVHLQGPVHAVTDAEADAYFATRPRGSQLGAWASAQSQPLPDRATLEARLDEVTRRFGEDPVPRPPLWGGFRVTPERLELWQGLPSRLHHRVLFARDDAGTWTRSLLYP